MAYEGMMVKLGVDDREVDKALRDAQKIAKGTTAELRNLQKALKFDPGNTDVLAQQQDAYQRKLTATQEKLKILKQALHEIETGERTADNSTVSKLRADIAATEAEAKKLERTMKEISVKGPFEQARNEVQKTTKALEILDEELKLDPTNVELLATRQETFTKHVEASQRELKTLEKYIEEVGKENIPVDEWAHLQTEISRCKRAVEQTDDEVEDLTKDFGKLGDKAASSLKSVSSDLTKAGDKIKDVSGKVQNVGDTMTRTITVPMAAAGVVAVKNAIDIDSAMTEVRKTVDATEAEYQQLKDAAIEYSQHNAVSAEEVLQVEALGAQLGFAKDTLEEFGEVATGLDIATNMDAETAATEMAHFKNIVGMADSEIRNYASTIVDLGNHSATTESEISGMAQRIAAAGKSVGMSAADILGVAAALSSLGLEAEAGGTAVSTIISNIDKDIALGTDNLNTWAETAGMSAEQFTQAWKDDPVKALEAVLKGMEAGVESGGNLSIMLDDLGISSIRQTDTMKRLAQSGDLLSDSVNRANDAWKDNTALSTEVENKNKSLSSKFEILKNRVIKVAEEVGEPLADALLEAVDAAEPLIKIVEDGAEAFSAMSEDEQKAVIQTGAMIAALGPLLSIAGRVGGTVGGAMKALGSLGEGITGKLSGGTKAIEGATGAMGALRSASVLAAGALAAVAIGTVVSYYADLAEKEKDAAEASMTVAEMEEKAKNASKDQADSLTDFIEKLGKFNEKVEDAANDSYENTDRIAKSNKKFVDSYKDALGDATVVEHYVGIIENLTKKTELNAKEQEDLYAAVDGYKEITGDNLEVIDASTGQLSKNTDALRDNADAWIADAYTQVYQEGIKDAIKDRLDAEEKLPAALDAQKDAAEKLAKAQEDLNNAYINGGSAEYIDSMNYNLQIAQGEYDKATEAVDTYNKNIENSDKKVQDYTTRIGELKGGIEETKRAVGDLSGVMNTFGDGFQQKLSDAHSSTDEFARKLHDAGVSAEELNSLGAEQVERFMTKCFEAGGSVDDVVERIKNAKTEIPQMAGVINEFGENVQSALEDAGTSTDDLATKLYDAGISTEDLQKVGAENLAKFVEECHGDFDQVAQRIKEYNDAELEDKEAKITADNSQAIDAIGETKREYKDLVDMMTSKIKIAYQQATMLGPWPQNAAGGWKIPAHADGGILDSPTLTNIGWVGEAGAEAIIPLTNRQYMAPFARTLAGFLNSGSETGGDTYNQVFIDGAILNSKPAIRDEAMKLLEDLAREGDMNRG